MAQDNRILPAPRPDDHLFPIDRRIRDFNKAHPRKEPTSLPRGVRILLQAMVYGVDQPLFLDGGHTPVPAGRPLSSKQAAFAVGFRHSRAEKWMKTRIWKDTLREMVKERAYAEEPENLAIAISIRDNVGDDTPEDRRIRLQAIGVIRPKDPAHAVNINLQQNNAAVQQISPGYVIKLDDPK